MSDSAGQYRCRALATARSIEPAHWQLSSRSSGRPVTPPGATSHPEAANGYAALPRRTNESLELVGELFEKNLPFPDTDQAGMRVLITVIQPL